MGLTPNGSPISRREGWLYLSAVLDLFSGLVVGWSMSHHQTWDMVMQALLMAQWQREDRSPVVLHSNRGCQFTSGEYLRFLKGHNLICSIGCAGSCANNVAVEGFFGLMKRERGNRRIYRLGRMCSITLSASITRAGDVALKEANMTIDA
jgi:putative transposase